MKKKAILALSIIFLILLTSSVSAEFWACFNKGDKIDYCNPKVSDRTCSSSGGCEYCMKNYNETRQCYNQGNWRICNTLLKECSNFGNSSVDKEPPVLTLNSPVQSRIYNSRSVLVDFVLDEEADVLYLDLINGRGRWKRVCQDCYDYSGRRRFNEGLNNLTFKAVDGIGNEFFLDRSFFIDSKNPQIHKTEPRSDYASGTFEIQYTEENLESIELIYGNDETGMKNKTATNCASGKRQWCSIDVDLSDYDGERIKYYFVVRDTAENEKKSQIRQNLIIDTIAPNLNNPDDFWVYTSGNRYVYFNLNVTENNLYKIEYIDNSASRPIWKNLCSRLRNGICETKKAFRAGHHNVDIQIIDKAGNAIGKNIEFEVVY